MNKPTFESRVLLVAVGVLILLFGVFGCRGTGVECSTVEVICEDEQ
jgi:hypothetical protein